MTNKFAIIDFDYDGKKPAASKLPKKFYRWYIKRNLPYSIEEIQIEGADGYRVALAGGLPGEEFTGYIMSEILRDLREAGVRIIKPPAGYSYEFGKIIPAASGFYLLPFLLEKTLKKALKIAGKTIEQAEIAVLDKIPDLTADIIMFPLPSAFTISSGS